MDKSGQKPCRGQLVSFLGWGCCDSHVDPQEEVCVSRAEWGLFSADVLGGGRRHEDNRTEDTQVSYYTVLFRAEEVVYGNADDEHELLNHCRSLKTYPNIFSLKTNPKIIFRFLSIKKKNNTMSNE